MHNEVSQAMRCEEALELWQQALLGRPVDPDKLEEAYTHFRTCTELCARVLSSAPDFALFPEPVSQPGRTDYYEARGLAAEDEGDTHALEWRRLQRLATVGKASQKAIDQEYALAIASWQAAVNYYEAGLKIDQTAFLTEGLKRLRRKRLGPARPSKQPAKADISPRQARQRVIKSPPAEPPAETPAQQPDITPAQQPPGAQPLLTFISRVSPRSITVGEWPPGWQRIAARPRAPLSVRESPSLYSSSPPAAQEPGKIARLEESQIGGLLAPFRLALSVTEADQRWALEVLVHASSPRRPWSSILLTLEDQQQQYYKPTLMEFSSQDSQRVGWQARLPEIRSGEYQLRLFANDAYGHAAKEAAMTLHLSTEEK